MKLNRPVLLACGAAVIAAVALALTARWNKLEAERLAAEKQALEQTHSELEKTRAALERSVGDAREETRKLNDAIGSSKQRDDEQRTEATRIASIASGLQAASTVKVAMTEYFFSEGKWPATNQQLGMPPPDSFKSSGVRSVGVIPGGTIQLVVDDLGKRADIFLNAAVNGASQVGWTCSTPSIPDIARLVPTCKFSSR